jgi:hypothetical protein
VKVLWKILIIVSAILPFVMIVSILLRRMTIPGFVLIAKKKIISKKVNYLDQPKYLI